MGHLLKNFWLGVLLLLLAAPAVAKHDLWEGYIKQVFRSSKGLVLTAKKLEPKSLNFAGIVQVPHYLYVSTYKGSNNSNAQLVFDNQVSCTYYSTHGLHYYKLSGCSNNTRGGESLNVRQKIELKINSAPNDSMSVIAKIKIIKSEEVQYGLYIPYVEATDGQILMFNGEAWVATDPSELALQGLQGEQGPIGPQGEPGIAGPMGPAGATGAAGPKGDKGDKGEAGIAGVAGTKGDKGDTGLTGAQGAKGDTGEMGFPGPMGLVGAKGDTGAMGPMGPQGAVGAAGAMGPIGPMGPAGEDGAAGPKGDTGSVGPMGPQGLTGAMGPAGADGAVGPKGDKGDKGDAGVAGAAGPKGDQGLPGLPGLQGEAGPQGSAGAVGAAGPKGDKGDPGMSKIAYIRDERNSGAQSGTCFANVWTPRVLNTLGGDTSFITLSNNRFTLTPGKYFVEAMAPFAQAGHGQVKLKVVETNTDVLYGTTGFSGTATQVSSNYSFAQGELIVTETSTFELSMRCQFEKTINGMGMTTNFGTREIWAQVKIIKTE